MQEFKKSKIFLYFNIIFSLVFVTSMIICLTKLGITNVNLGIDLYLIFSIAFFVFAFPFLLNLFRYLLQPKKVLTIEKNHFIIHTRKTKKIIQSNNLLGVSKVTNLGEYLNLDIGTLKILLKNSEKAIYIRNLENLDSAYQTLNILIIKYFENNRK